MHKVANRHGCILIEIMLFLRNLDIVIRLLLLFLMTLIVNTVLHFFLNFTYEDHITYSLVPGSHVHLVVPQLYVTTVLEDGGYQFPVRTHVHGLDYFFCLNLFFELARHELENANQRIGR
jgi:hypothetical protein